MSLESNNAFLFGFVAALEARDAGGGGSRKDENVERVSGSASDWEAIAVHSSRK